MEESRFEIIYKKMDEYRIADQAQEDKGKVPDYQEIEEIAELRRIVLEVTEPVRNYYTATSHF